MSRQICIVGAGLSGLLACKHFLSKGYTPLVFESRPSLGGVWTKTIETTRLQTPKSFYQFTDYPWPSSIEVDFPNQNQVLDYIQSYAQHFGLVKHISFNTKVLSIKYEGPYEEEMQSWSLWNGNGEPFGCMGKWTLTVQHVLSLSIQVVEVDFVILCMGRFSDLPNIPEFPVNNGPEAFQGKVIHSMEYASLDYDSARHLIQGKRVTIVGSLKFALDIAMESSLANGVDTPCTVICRTPHWHLPDYFPWGFPLALLYFNRFSELLVHKPGEGLFFSLLASLLSPLRWGISKFVESYIKTKNRLKKFNMVPKHSFLQDLNASTLAIVPDGFYNNVEKGSIVLKRSESFSFCRDGVVVGDGSDIIRSDLVILATGFKGDVKLKNIFESPKFQDHIMGSTDQSVPLYRQVIHPRIPQLAVIGFSESLTNLYTSEIRCRWLAELLDGKFRLPSIQEMEKDVLEWDKFMKRYSIGKYYRRSSIAGLHIWCNDQLCKDIGGNHKRKTGFWAELFEPYGPMDYASL